MADGPQLSLVDKARFAHLDWREDMTSFLTDHARRYASEALGYEPGDIDVSGVAIKPRRVDLTVESIPFRYTRTENTAGKVTEKLEASIRNSWHVVEDLVSLGRAIMGGDDDPE